MAVPDFVLITGDSMMSPRRIHTPLPCIDDTLDALEGGQWFSALDLKSGYWQVQLSEDAKE